MSPFRATPTVLLLSTLLGLGCAGVKELTQPDADRIKSLSESWAKAEAMDGRECAPKELAVSQALIDYVRYEASKGKATPEDFQRAEQAVAELTAKAEPCWRAKQDDDGDGVANASDKCPDTPKEARVDQNGCPVDSDKDGVPDYLDKCAETPKDVKVDKDGCPEDSDADGVPDYLDKCKDTPKEAKVDKEGCPVDSDKDGVPDYLDKCPETPDGAKVGEDGCPVN